MEHQSSLVWLVLIKWRLAFEVSGSSACAEQAERLCDAISLQPQRKFSLKSPLCSPPPFPRCLKMGEKGECFCDKISHGNMPASPPPPLPPSPFAWHSTLCKPGQASTR